MTTPAPNLDAAVLKLWQRPGGPPTEREAARLLGVSQWAVREALARLWAAGKIDRIRPGKRLAYKALVTMRVPRKATGT